MDDLEHELRAANPLRARRTDPLSARAEHELTALLATAPAASPTATAPAPASPVAKPMRIGRRIGWALAAAAVLVVATLITVTSLGVSPQASVAAPPQLEITPLDATLEEVVIDLAANARTFPGYTGSAQTWAWEEWAADIRVEEDSTSFFVQPREVRWVRNDDLSGSIEVRAGEVRWGDPSDPDDAAEPGEVLESYELGPGEFVHAFPEPPPETGAEMKAYFDANLGYDATTPTGHYFQDLGNLRVDWTLTGPQAAAALEMVGGLPQVELLGEVTDRLGRVGIAISTDDVYDGTGRIMLIFDAETGVLLSSEMIYFGGHPDMPMPADSVVNYTAWKEPL